VEGGEPRRAAVAERRQSVRTPPSSLWHVNGIFTDMRKPSNNRQLGAGSLPIKWYQLARPLTVLRETRLDRHGGVPRPGRGTCGKTYPGTTSHSSTRYNIILSTCSELDALSERRRVGCHWDRMNRCWAAMHGLRKQLQIAEAGRARDRDLACGRGAEGRAAIGTYLVDTRPTSCGQGTFCGNTYS
jgi:hypothetical protein